MFDSLARFIGVVIVEEKGDYVHIGGIPTRIIFHDLEKAWANPLLATIQSLSTAVPIICANTVIFLNQPFRSNDKEQAIARVARLGQDEQTYVWDVLLDTKGVPNISTRSDEILQWSMEQVAIIMGEEPTTAQRDAIIAQYLGEDNSFFKKIVDYVRSYFGKK